jgi:hypothetical protein
MKQKTESIMRPLVEAYACYPGSKKAFCEEHGLAAHTLDYWRRKFSDHRGETSDFVALKMIPPGAYGHWLEVHYPNGVRVVVSAEAPLVMLQSLIQLGS